MWLQDFLSKDLPRCRTLIYGYNSKLQSRGINTILNYGAEFMEELKKVRCTAEEIGRPLILIGHSFGGLIVAHTLIKAKQADQDNNPTIAALYDAISAMMFFGTPHRGLLIDDIQSMLGEDPTSPRTALVEHIQYGSQRLADQLNDFKNLIRHRKIVSFIEMQQTRRLVKSSNGDGSWSRSGDFITAVDPHSALLQLPDHQEVKISVDADHSAIVKFDSRVNSTYRSALKYLKEFEQVLGQPAACTASSSVRTSSPVLQSPLDELQLLQANEITHERVVPRVPKEAVERIGATIVYEPEGREPLADIVFVHGLGGHPWETWAFQFDHHMVRTGYGKIVQVEGAVFWPADLLPKDCPTARIITWGFNFEPSKPSVAPRDRFFAHADDLVTALVKVRPLGRSLIFVSHSLGGILVKEALRQSDSGQTAAVKDIANYTAANIFLGTPHRGDTDTMSLCDIIERAASLMLGPEYFADRQFLECDDVETCRESFISQWKMYDFRVKTFHESISEGVSVRDAATFRTKQEVIPKISASFEHSSDRPESITGDHINMCKFESLDDPGYRKISIELQLAINYVEGQQLHRRSECLASLYFAELQDREYNINPALKSTCEWLFESPDYKAWFNWDVTQSKSERGLLWLKGKPGAGKSTLMKEALRRAKEWGVAESVAVAGFFFTTRGNIRLQKTPLGLFRTVLYDLLQQDKVLLSSFILVFLKKRSTITGPWQWHQQELQNFLRSAYLGDSQRVGRAILFIDALDECDEGEYDVVRDLVYYFRDLTAGPKLKICLSSRHYPYIKVPDCPQITVEAHNSLDILHYVETRLSPAGHDERAQKIARKITEKAEGVFLWVVLMVKNLNIDLDNERTEQDLEETLRIVPKTLEELFESLFKDLRSTSERKKAVAIIQWILLAARPIKMHELRHALTLSAENPCNGRKDWGKAGDCMPDDLERFLTSLRSYTRGLGEVVLQVGFRN